MPIASTDAGADSAVQPGASAPSDEGAIFDILMAAGADNLPSGGSLDANQAKAPVAASPILPGDELPLPAVSPDPTSQVLASDMEHMVQALAITAEVVAQGMAARTTPVREIILTVEAPIADAMSGQTSPKLSVQMPAVEQPSLTLKISDADPASNLDPDLVALLPQIHLTPAAPSKRNEANISDTDPVSNLDPDFVSFLPQKHVTPAAHSQRDEAKITESELDRNISDNLIIAGIVQVQESPALQSLSAPLDEPHGPWREELYGPLLTPERALNTQPVHILRLESPATMAPAAVQNLEPTEANQITPDQTQSVADTLALGHDRTQTLIHVGADMPIRTVTIHVPIIAKAEIDMNDDAPGLTDDDIKASVPSTEGRETSSLQVIHVTRQIVAPLETSAAQSIVTVSLPQPMETSSPSQIAAEDELKDALQAPRLPLPDAQIHMIKQEQAANASVAAPKFTTQPSLAAPSTAMPPDANDIPAFDVGAVVEALHKDANLARAAHQKPLDDLKFATNSEIIIASPVAKTSSRSNANIRDLVKMGVRDIEIVQGTGSEQAMNVSPQVQNFDSNSATTATRAQVADAFAPSGNEANNAERRAQAHEIRMRAIERQVIAAVRDGADTIRMQLYPPGLGQIVIRMTMDGSKLKLTTNASSSEAVESLRSIEGDLRDALSVGGLELTGFDVSEDGEQREKNRKDTSETEMNSQTNRSAKPGTFALDMNA